MRSIGGKTAIDKAARHRTTRAHMSCSSTPCACSSFAASPGETASMRRPWPTPRPPPSLPGAGGCRIWASWRSRSPGVILMPAQTPCGQELPGAPQRALQALRDCWLRIAHVTSSVKRCRIVTTASACGRRTSALSSWISAVRYTTCDGAPPLALHDCIARNSHSHKTSARFGLARIPHGVSTTLIQPSCLSRKVL